MEIFAINKEGNLIPSDEQAVHNRNKEGGLPQIVIIPEKFDEAPHPFLDSLNLHPLLIEKCTSEEDDIGTTIFKDTLLMNIPLQHDWDTEVNLIASFICIPGALIVLNEQNLPFGQNLINQLKNISALSEQSTAAFLYYSLDKYISHVVGFVSHGRSEITKLRYDIEQNNIDNIISVIQKLRSRLNVLEGTFDDLHRTLNGLLGSNSPALEIKEVQEYFRDLISQIEYGIRRTERMGNDLEAVHKDYLLKLQDKTSTRLGILTIISAIFIPLTLIAGIFGMNFEFMPILSWKYGYPVILLIMGLIALLCLFYFYKKGWFRDD
jgi:magnesium/cobalt transport protein CorA